MSVEGGLGHQRPDWRGRGKPLSSESSTSLAPAALGDIGDQPWRAARKLPTDCVVNQQSHAARAADFKLRFTRTVGQRVVIEI